MFTAATSASLLALAGSAFAAGLNASTVAEIVQELRLAPTKVDQFKITTDELSVFDFNAAQAGDIGVTTGVAGHTVAADSANFPAVVGNGVSMSEYIILWILSCALHVSQPLVTSVPAA